MVEHRTFNAGVEGSSPPTPTKSQEGVGNSGKLGRKRTRQRQTYNNEKLQLSFSKSCKFLKTLLTNYINYVIIDIVKER